MTKAGKIIIRGAYLLNSSSGVNRIIVDRLAVETIIHTMLIKPPCLLALGLLSLTNPASANPCAAARVDGRSLVSPGSRPQIRIVEERIAIDLKTKPDEDNDAAESENGEAQVAVYRKRFQIDYLFDNRGRNGEWVIGFPVVAPGIAVENASPLSKFSVTGDGIGERVAPEPATFSRWTGPAVLHWCERFALRSLKKRVARSQKKAYQFEKTAIQTREIDKDGEEHDHEVVGWYFWRQRFAAGRTRLRVAYTLTGGGLCQTNYVLRTARAWGNGTIDKLSIDLTIDAPAHLKGFRAVLGTIPEALGKARLGPGRQMPVKPKLVDEKKGRAVWEWQQFTADRDFILFNEPCGEG